VDYVREVVGKVGQTPPPAKTATVAAAASAVPQAVHTAPEPATAAPTLKSADYRVRARLVRTGRRTDDGEVTRVNNLGGEAQDASMRNEY
jgi:hypothetical protein